MTAALAAQGTATMVGERTGGWFWLSPWSLWQDWAKLGLEAAAERMALKGYFLDEYRQPGNWAD